MSLKTNVIRTFRVWELYAVISTFTNPPGESNVQQRWEVPFPYLKLMASVSVSASTFQKPWGWNIKSLNSGLTHLSKRNSALRPSSEFSSGIAGPKGSSIFNFLRKLHTAFHSGCTSLCTPTNSALGFPFLHILTSTCYLLIYWWKAILTGMKYLTVALICISLMISDIEHLFICLLAICMSSSEKCLFRSRVFKYYSLQKSVNLASGA